MLAAVQEIEYGLDLETGQYYIQPTGGEARYFEDLQHPVLKGRVQVVNSTSWSWSNVLDAWKN